MRVFEYGKKSNMTELTSDQQRFTAKMIIQEVQQIAKEHNVSEEMAYWGYMHGLYDGDREL